MSYRWLKLWTSEGYVIVSATPIGWVSGLFSPRGLVRTGMVYQSEEEALSAVLVGRMPDGTEASSPEVDVEQVHKWFASIVAYFEGKNPDLGPISLDESSWSPFARKVYRCVRAIPPGVVKHYGQIALEVGSPQAARAVGRAMAVNPVPPVIPCHRVVASDGRLCGFSASGGLELKVRMLNLEGVRVVNNRVVK